MDSLQKSALLLNNPNPDAKLEEGRKLNKKHLINTLNYINFQDGTILINFRHLKYGNILSLHAKPQPYFEKTLDCLWLQPAGLCQKLNSYKCLNFLINDGQEMMLVAADVIRISEEGISFDLPETCYEVSFRKARRHACEGIQAELIQNSVIFHGALLDFNAVSFRIEISTEPPQSFQFINPESTVYIIFKNGKDILYSGECRIIRQTFGQKLKTLVLEPTNDKICRFKHKEYRSSRHKLLPSPTIIFRHPLTQTMINLEVDDLSSTGFSVEEYYDHSVLLPGMIIPELYIEITNNFNICCKAQVVHRNIYKTDEDKTFSKCGVAILDMDIQDQVRLSSLLHQVTNRKSYVCNIVDLDALWKFFFEVGFVYPEKYAFIHANKEKFKETYRKLYIQSPTIARHFIYQDKGIIQGHMSMVRFYENTWLIHHHAASRAGYSRAGLVVLDQVGRYVNEFHSLDSTHMNFVICYFRPHNKFPNRVFGGFARDLNNPKGSSLDSFAYFHFPRAFEKQNLQESWTITKTRPEDLIELQGFYEYKSGGLMLHALDLEPGMIDCDELNKEYQRFGFKREKHLFSLKKNDTIKAVIMVTLSDLGLNLSNLTNCIHVIVLDPDDLTSDILCLSLSQLSHYFEKKEIPILLYPMSYADGQSISYEKTYTLWVLNMQNTDDYFKYMTSLFTRT